MSKGKNIVVGVTGASGSLYARLILERLLASDEVGRIGLVISRRGVEVAEWERVEFPAGERVEVAMAAADLATQKPLLELFSNDDMFASPASGSARWDAMAVVPCSMGCVGRIASGAGGDLIARAADVMLKEGRTLIVVPRETPLNLIHLRNLTTLAEAGAVILPASPSFYSRPETLEAACATVADRIFARLGLDFAGYEWNGK